jgi:hypothetical protein
MAVLPYIYNIHVGESTTARMAFVNHPDKYAISPGLNAVCSALSDAGIHDETMPTQIVRDACATRGFLAGWRSLSTLYPTLATSLNSPLLDDVTKCMEVYERIRPVTKPPTTTCFHMTISRDPNQLSLEIVPPKVIGGTAWTLNHEYEVIVNNWMNAGFPLLPPCIAFGWPGVQRKIISRNHLNYCDALTLLITVDYDLDRQGPYHSAFSHAMTVGRRYISESGTKMQRAALASFLGLDLQVNVRTVQESWITNGAVGGNLGPDDVTTSDWVSAMIGDCDIYTGCGYEDQNNYRKTRTGLFTGAVVGNIHDIIYDIATSNRVSSAQYASAAGVAEFNLHCAFVTTITDGVAHRVLSSSPEDVPILGDNALLAAEVWVLFNERYRTWERFVKYLRILGRSNSPEAQNILNMARAQMVWNDSDIDDVDEAWKKAMTRGSETDLTPRNTTTYPLISAAPEMAQIPGLLIPDLCPLCRVEFQDTLLSFKNDRFHGIPGLPTSVTTCPAVARAAAIRRVALYASDDDACCDRCACKIGRWADAAGYMVCGALMSNESATSASDWLLQCYAVWSVSLSPISVMTVLSGFDLLCEVKCEDGAMGSRDVLDTWEAVEND